MKKAFIAIVALSLVFIFGNFIYLNYSKWEYNVQPVNISGTLIPKGKNLPAFILNDGSGSFDDSRLLNRWSIMFFGYTRCPDICPNTLSILNKMYKQVDDLPRKKRPQVLFISVDSEHDTNDTPNKYAKYFNKNFTGLSGTEAQLDSLTKGLGVVSTKVQVSADNYIYDHSSTLFIINPKGQLQAILSAPFTAEQLAKDYRVLLNKYS